MHEREYYIILCHVDRAARILHIVYIAYTVYERRCANIFSNFRIINFILHCVLGNTLPVVYLKPRLEHTLKELPTRLGSTCPDIRTNFSLVPSAAAIKVLGAGHQTKIT